MDDLLRGSYRALCVILVGRMPTEVSQNFIADVMGDETLVTGNPFAADGAVVVQHAA